VRDSTNDSSAGIPYRENKNTTVASLVPSPAGAMGKRAVAVAIGYRKIKTVSGIFIPRDMART